MKLPESFPKIKKPYFVLGAPLWLQIMIMIILFFLEIVVIYLFYYNLKIKPGPLWVQVIILAVAIGFGFMLVHKQLWRRWIVLIANEEGCYFRYFKSGDDHFVFVAWQNVGAISIQDVHDGDGVYKAIVLKIKVSKEVWESQFSNENLFPQWAQFLKSKVDENGFRDYFVANQFQNVENTLSEILKYKNKIM